MKRITRLSRQALKHALAVSVLAGACVHSASGAPSVLQVGTFHGIAGHYKSIQAAVDAAKPGDWILIAPGDYRENGGVWFGAQVGVWVATPGIHLRGMDRNQVIVDGTKGGPPCSASPGDQNVLAGGSDGIEVFRVVEFPSRT